MWGQSSDSSLMCSMLSRRNTQATMGSLWFVGFTMSIPSWQSMEMVCWMSLSVASAHSFFWNLLCSHSFISLMPSAMTMSPCVKFAARNGRSCHSASLASSTMPACFWDPTRWNMAVMPGSVLNFSTTSMIRLHSLEPSFRFGIWNAATCCIFFTNPGGGVPSMLQSRMQAFSPSKTSMRGSCDCFRSLGRPSGLSTYCTPSWAPACLWFVWPQTCTLLRSCRRLSSMSRQPTTFL
mmetsp:Transcript_20946/g.58857  ORF Transcript_20946/g.58857 Transcript_20946/m.58857 type:complete len:236 (-) Transcript_20946:219-926(-)